MSFVRANALGWGMFEVLTSAQMNALDIDHANSVDGVGSSTYNPTSLGFGSSAIVVWGTNNVPRLSARSIYRQVGLQGFDDQTGTSWGLDASGALNQLATGLDPVVVEITDAVREAGQISGLRAEVAAYPGVHSQTPATMPVLRLLRLEKQLVSGSQYSYQRVVVASQTDTSAPAGSAVSGEIAAFETLHLIDLTLGSPEVAFIHRGQNLSSPFDMYRYFAALLGESGTGAQVGFSLKALAVKQDITRLEP